MSSSFAILWWWFYYTLDSIGQYLYVQHFLLISPRCKFMMTIVRSGNRSVCATLAPSPASTLIVVNLELYCNGVRHKISSFLVSSAPQEIFNLFSQYESFGDMPFLYAFKHGWRTPYKCTYVGPQKCLTLFPKKIPNLINCIFLGKPFSCRVYL